MNLFEIATREAYRYPSNKNELTTEQLWDLPLESKSGFDLNSVAKAVNNQLKAVTEESFVSPTTAPGKVSLTNKLEVVKHIIATKIAENERLRLLAARKVERDKLINMLGKKEDAVLEGLTVEQIKARLDQLESGALS